MRCHRWQPIRLLRPWDSPGKNTGVGCHFLLQCVKVKIESEVTQLCPTLCEPMDCSLPGSSIHRIFEARVWSGVPVPSPHPLHGSAQMRLEVEFCLMLQTRAQAANALILALWYPKHRIQLNRTSDLKNWEIKIHVTLSFQVYSKTIMQQ